MAELLAWRNPQKKEENWINRRQGIYDQKEHYQKVVSAEIGLVLLALTSTIETVACTALTLTSLALYPITDKPYQFFAKVLQSSSFTILWAIADTLIYNPFFVNVMTHESFARYWAEMLNPTSIELFRFDDRLYITDWEWEHRQAAWGQHVDNTLLGPIVKEEKDIQKQIDAGAHFIKEEVLSDASPNTVSLFCEMDASMFMYILAKSVYIYAAGSKKETEIPGFFKKETKTLIEAFRKESYIPETLQQLEQLLTDPNHFEAMPEDTVNSVFVKLKNIASGELQNSLYTTRCWKKAIKLLTKAP